MPRVSPTSTPARLRRTNDVSWFLFDSLELREMRIEMTDVSRIECYLLRTCDVGLVSKYTE